MSKYASIREAASEISALSAVAEIAVSEDVAKKFAACLNTIIQGYSKMLEDGHPFPWPLIRNCREARSAVNAMRAGGDNE